MDIILPGNKSQARLWAETMINLEARKLVNTANIVGARHLGDGLTRLKFIDEIKSVINGEFERARRAKSDEECMTACVTCRQKTAVCLSRAGSSRPVMRNYMPRSNTSGMKTGWSVMSSQELKWCWQVCRAYLASC